VSAVRRVGAKRLILDASEAGVSIFVLLALEPGTIVNKVRANTSERHFIQDFMNYSPGTPAVASCSKPARREFRPVKREYY